MAPVDLQKLQPPLDLLANKADHIDINEIYAKGGVMNETDPIDFQLSRQNNNSGGGHSNEIPYVSFDRQELNLILGLYGLHVGAGEWRDYAIDMLKDRAVFSIFRHTSDVPLYRIEKDPRLARRQGAYSVITASGQILKRGRDLGMVLRILKPKPRLAVF